MKAFNIKQVILIVSLVIVIGLGSFVYYLYTHKQAPISTCISTLVGQNKNPFIYEMNANNISDLPAEEILKLRLDKRRVALNAFYKNDKITLGMICEGCVKAEVSFGYQPTTASNWCSLALTSKKIETGDEFYHQVDEIEIKLETELIGNTIPVPQTTDNPGQDENGMEYR